MKTMTIRGCLFCVAATVLWCSSNAVASPPGVVTERMMIDQFGYLPAMTKIAVIASPQVGFNAPQNYTPGAVLEVRTWPDHQSALSGVVTAWNNGATHDQSGDKVWWFDFSMLTRPGSYYIYDPRNDTRSHVFDISVNVYNDALKQATRMYFYQRSGFAKRLPFADARWIDAASHPHDARARLVTAPNDASTEKDLSGGLFDAGDYNKYVTFTMETLSDLLFAYRNNPEVWGDNFDLPESGNGVPDILDEIKWELDWLLKMQNADGSVLSKLSVTQYQHTSPPSADSAPRYYGAASTSATLAGAASFAHAALAFNSINTAYAEL